MTTATQQIYVSRSDENSRQSALEQVKERALDNRWPHLLIFPEGMQFVTLMWDCHELSGSDRMVYKSKGLTALQER